MEKEFVTYDQSLALKELGFDEPCLAIHSNANPKTGLYTLKKYRLKLIKQASQKDKGVKAPLKQQVFRWFREKYNINSHIEYYPSSEDTVAYFFIADEDESINYGTYEEAEEKCIKFLIETVKNM